MKKIFGALLAFSWTFGLFALPIDDLASPVQQIRDTAAKQLKGNYKPVSKTNWNAFVAKIKRGDSKTNVLAIFPPPGPKQEAFFVGAGTSTASYRLDDLWVLVCYWNDVKGKLIDFQLGEQMRHVWVQPPTEFTGVWTTYFVNGQPSSVIHYKEGKYFGDFTSYRADGSKAYIQHYGAKGCEGEETGWYPSGKVFYKGQYKDGIQVGTWTWFNEDGSIKNEKQFPTL